LTQIISYEKIRSLLSKAGLLSPGKYMPKNRPRYVVIGPCAGRHRGGIAQFTSELVQRLRLRAEVLFCSWYELYPQFLFHREIAAGNEPASVTEAQFSLGFSNPFSWKRTADRIWEFQPEKIFFTWIHPVHSAVYLRLLHLLRRSTAAELICICHNVLPHEPFPAMTALSSAVFRRFDRLIVHSADDYARIAPLRGRVCTHTLFLPLFDFLPQQPIARRKRPSANLLFFGSIRPYKGLDILLASLPLVRKEFPAVRLHIAGEVFYRRQNRLFRLLTAAQEYDPTADISHLDLQSCVSIDTRYLPDEELPQLFADADAAIFPFRETNQSASINAAFAYGVPVIASRVGGISEYILHGVNGMLVEPGDPTSLAEGITTFLRQPIPAEWVYASTRQFSWTRYVNELLAGSNLDEESRRTAKAASAD
jgi:glycosyltransferase involved in cell wall biosynthesis